MSHANAPVTIRPAREGDLDAILEMVAKTCAMHERMSPLKHPFLPEPAKRYRWWLSRCMTDKTCVVLVAEGGGRVVGFVVADTEDEIPIYRVKRFGFVHDLWVEEGCRRHGAARRLMDELVERFRSIGVDQVRLDVLLENTAARRLFEACGFRETVVEMVLPFRKGEGA